MSSSETLRALADAADAVARAARAIAAEGEQLSTAPADDLILIVPAVLEDRGFEFKPIARAVESGELRSVKIGRPRYTKMSWVLAWAERLPAAVGSASESTDDLADAVRGRALRRAL